MTEHKAKGIKIVEDTPKKTNRKVECEYVLLAGPSRGTVCGKNCTTDELKLKKRCTNHKNKVVVNEDGDGEEEREPIRSEPINSKGSKLTPMEEIVEGETRDGVVFKDCKIQPLKEAPKNDVKSPSKEPEVEIKRGPPPLPTGVKPILKPATKKEAKVAAKVIPEGARIIKLPAYDPDNLKPAKIQEESSKAEESDDDEEGSDDEEPDSDDEEELTPEQVAARKKTLALIRQQYIEDETGYLRKVLPLERFDLEDGDLDEYLAQIMLTMNNRSMDNTLWELTSCFVAPTIQYVGNSAGFKLDGYVRRVHSNEARIRDILKKIRNEKQKELEEYCSPMIQLAGALGAGAFMHHMDNCAKESVVTADKVAGDPAGKKDEPVLYAE